jgi:Fic family protein
LSIPAIVEICSAVLGHQMTIRPSEGVYIGDPLTRTRGYTPPRAPGAHLDRLIEFIHDPGGLDPLVATALAHYQFEAIHPFTDGNGRAGRVLNAVLIDHYGLLAWPVAYLSRYFIKTKAEYYSGLEGVTARGDWHGWVQYFLDGVLASARNSLRLIDEIEDVQASLADVARHRLGRLDAALVPALVANPYVRAAQVAEVCGVTRQTASTWLGTLSADNGPLTAHRMGRNTVYANQALMETLTRPADSSA